MAARVGTLSRYALYRDQPDSLAWDFARYRAVTPATVLATAQRWLDPQRRVEVLTVPRAPGGDDAGRVEETED
jgi:predicted Zn-dependent peptidase